MIGELWFYATTVLICTGYAFLLQSYPQWKSYFSLALAGFVIAGGVVVYWDAKRQEDTHTKIGQLEHMLDVAKKDAETQKALTKDATDRAHLLAEQLKTKTDELSKVLKDKPHIDGEIKSVRIFPWQRVTPHTHADGTTTATGVLVVARVENDGSRTTLTNWELSIQLSDHTIVRPHKWPVKKALRISCEDGSIHISRDEYLDANSKQTVQRAEERAGATVWMVKNIPLSTVEDAQSFYTLTVRDDTGVVHALKTFSLSSLPKKCSGFDVVD